jgi:YVTN family beta-propeller protein
MKKGFVLIAALVAACNTQPPQVLPPPFGPDGPSPTRLFFPTGLEVTNEGGLLVANGNFNHAYDSGTMVGISRAYLDRLFNLQLDCGAENRDANACIQPINESDFTGAVLIGSYAGPMAMNAARTAVYTGSRDSGTLNAVRVDPGGALGCSPGAGNEAAKDCRTGLLDLVPFGVDGPFSIVQGDVVMPGTSVHQPVFFVSSVIPHVENVSSGVVSSSSSVAALSMDDPSQVLFTAKVAQPFVANGAAVGPMIFDSVRRSLYLSGCYQRTVSLGAGETGTSFCIIGATVNNFLRILNVDAGSAADPTLIDLRSDLLSITTVQMILADPDPVTGAPTTLWATMRSPDVLARYELPPQPSVAPRLRAVIPMPVAPADMVLIDRGSASSLLAVATEKSNSVTIVDTGTDQVVAEVSRFGDSPFILKQIPCPSGNTASACLATSVFGACAIGLIEINKAQPSQTTLRALAGSCP